MSKPIEEMSLSEIQAERAAIAAERAAMEAEKAAGPGGYAIPIPADYEQVPVAPPDLVVAPDPTAEDSPDESDDDDKPQPWPHQHLVYQGMELEARTPNQSALMAISMLQQLDGMGKLQMEIFNTFLANHLSAASLAKVIMELTRPDTEITIQGLVQALVDLRIQESKAS